MYEFDTPTPPGFNYDLTMGFQKPLEFDGISMTLGFSLMNVPGGDTEVLMVANAIISALDQLGYNFQNGVRQGGSQQSLIESTT